MRKILLFSMLAVSLVFAPFASAEPKAEDFAGRTLLAVENHGEVWWVDPETLESQYLGKPQDFLSSMRKHAIGINEADFATVKQNPPRRLAGRFLLRVEEGGKIAYIEPRTMTVYEFENAEEAIAEIKELSLGVNNQNLRQIKQNRQRSRNASAGASPAITDRADASPVVNAGDEEIVSIAEDFVSTYLTDGADVEVTIDEEMEGLYHLNIRLAGGQEIKSAISADGKIFYPQMMVIAEVADKAKDTAKNNTNTNTNTSPTTNMTQTDKPTVELFVMSHCPYGTQMEKAIMPVVEQLGSTIDFEVKYVDYAMHGKKEVDEQLNQYCIQAEQNDKFMPYLKCFLEAGDGESCLVEAGIDTASMDSCVSATDGQYGITEAYDDRDSWLNGRYPVFDIHGDDNDAYGVQGSPTLVINGQKVRAARNPNALLNTICQAFSEKPAECDADMSSTTPSPGFGYNAATSNTAATCG